MICVEKLGHFASEQVVTVKCIFGILPRHIHFASSLRGEKSSHSNETTTSTSVQLRQVSFKGIGKLLV